MIFLKFATAINGDSQEAGHEKWISIDSLQFGVGRAIDSGAGGATRKYSNPSFSEVSLTKPADIASAELMFNATAGKQLGLATIHFLHTGAENKGKPYIILELGEALISSYSLSGSGDSASESFSINFATFKMQYDQYKTDGSVQTGTAKGWNVVKNIELT